MKLIDSPMNFTGSKFRILSQLLPRFDKTKSCMVDLFAGGGAVYANVAPHYKYIWINDIIKELVEIHEGLVYEGWKFVNRVEKVIVSKDDEDGYYALRDSFNREKTPEKLYALMLSCTNNMMRFNQSFEFNQTFGRRSYNPETERKLMTFIKFIRPYAGKLHFTIGSFKDVDPNHPEDTFIYADPPYSSTEAGYNAYWSDDDEEALYRYLINHGKNGGTFALSGIVGCAIIDRMMKEGFPFAQIEHDYERVARIKGRHAQEILIMNYHPRPHGLDSYMEI